MRSLISNITFDCILLWVFLKYSVLYLRKVANFLSYGIHEYDLLSDSLDSLLSMTLYGLRYHRTECCCQLIICSFRIPVG